MARSENPWEPEWKRGNSLGEGGQGKTFLARRSSDPPDSWRYVLKLIRNEDRPDSRARIAIEAAALKLLDHPGVAKLVFSNTAQYKEEVPLYLITEHIPGPDLKRFRAGHGPSLREAAQMLIRVLQTLRDCHALGVIHRDIKPDNVILRDGKLDAPMLIDFGLAFGDELGPSDHSTVTEQGVGNRIFLLPEQLADPAAKRDPVSDITQVVGLLFILLFNKAPVSLAHQKGLKPHERFEWRSQLSNLEKWQLDQLALIFNTGFELDPAQRWPSAERLIAELEVLTLDSPPPPKSRSVEERIKQLRSQANNSTNQLLVRMETLSAAVYQAVVETSDKIYQEFTQHITLVRLGSANWEAAARRFRFQLSLQARLKGTPQQIITYSLELFGTDIFVYRDLGDSMSAFVSPFPPDRQNPSATPPPGHLLRVPAYDPRAKEDIQTIIEDDVQELVEAALSHVQGA